MSNYAGNNLKFYKTQCEESDKQNKVVPRLFKIIKNKYSHFLVLNITQKRLDSFVYYQV